VDIVENTADERWLLDDVDAIVDLPTDVATRTTARTAVVFIPTITDISHSFTQKQVKKFERFNGRIRGYGAIGNTS
jgi:hypothetical protein